MKAVRLSVLSTGRLYYPGKLISFYNYGFCNLLLNGGRNFFFHWWDALTLNSSYKTPYFFFLHFVLFSCQYKGVCSVFIYDAFVRRQIAPEELQFPLPEGLTRHWFTHSLLQIATIQTSSHFHGIVQSVSLLTTRYDTLFSKKFPLYSIRKKIEFKMLSI